MIRTALQPFLVILLCSIGACNCDSAPNTAANDIDDWLDETSPDAGAGSGDGLGDDEALAVPGGDVDPADPEGDGDGAGAGASGGDGDGSGPLPQPALGSDGPVIVDPCEVFAGEVARDLIGKEASLEGDAAERRAICQLKPASGTGMALRLEVHLNSDDPQGFFDEWKKQRMEAVEALPVGWSPMGEIRTLLTEAGGPVTPAAASLWAVVLDEDYIGRVVFIWIEVRPYAPEGETFAVPIDTQLGVLEEAAAILRDALYAAQG